MTKKKQENMICKICLTPIHPDSSYIHLIDYKDGELFMHGFYHNSCWNQKLNNIIGKSRHEMINKANMVMDKAMKVIG